MTDRGIGARPSLPAVAVGLAVFLTGNAIAFGVAGRAVAAHHRKPLAAANPGSTAEPGVSVPAARRPPRPLAQAAPTTSARPRELVIRKPDPWPEGCCAPLTGMGYDDPVLAAWTTHSVKIDNSTDAPPHRNLQKADLIYELRVEDVSRFIAIYHSRLPEIVGPIRSARTSDPAILAALGHPIVSFSGGNPGVRKVFHELPWLLDANGMVAGGYYFRDFDHGHVIPHNLYVHARDLRNAHYNYGGPPQEQFHILTPTEANPPGQAVKGVQLQVGNVPSRFEWDPSTRYWLREEYGKPHTDDDGEQIGRRNVVILAVNYGRSGVDSRSPEAVTVGSGEAWVLVEGQLYLGSWSRATPESPWKLQTADGTPISLSRGPTWVDLVNIAPRFEF